jgi:hypothetical protein
MCWKYTNLFVRIEEVSRKNFTLLTNGFGKSLFFRKKNMRSTLYLLIALTIFSNAYAQDSVNVEIVRENPKDMTKLFLGFHVGINNRQNSGLFLGLGLDYDLVNRISLEGLAQYSPGFFYESSRFEYQIGGNFYLVESRLKKRKAKVYTDSESFAYYRKVTYTRINLNTIERFGVRVGTNQFFAAYEEGDFYPDYITGGSAYLMKEKTSSPYLGIIFEIRQAATVDIEGYGRRIHEKKLQIYADILLRAGGDSEYSVQPQMPFGNRNLGGRVGFRSFRTSFEKGNGMGYKVEVGTFPDLILPSSGRFPQLFVMFGSHIQLGIR